MSYKPLSQTVTDGQKNPISSDAVHDHVASEIAAIPAGASLTLDNLTAPTAVNQDLNMGVNRLVFNSANTKAALNAKELPDIATGVMYVPYANPVYHPTLNPVDKTLINTDTDITNILQIGDVIYLNGLSERAVILQKITSTQVRVSRVMGDGSSREIYIEPSHTSFVNSSTNALNVSKSGLLTIPAGTLASPPIQFANDPTLGIYSPAEGQISFSAREADNLFSGSKLNRERIRFDLRQSSLAEVRLIGVPNFTISNTSTAGLKFGWDTQTPVTFLSVDRSQMYLHRPTSFGSAESSQGWFNDVAGHFGLLAHNGLGVLGLQRFFTAAFRKKVHVGNVANPGYFLDGGIVSVHGYEEAVGTNGTILTDSSVDIFNNSFFSGSTVVLRTFRGLGMGRGDKIQLTKSGQLDITRKIIAESPTVLNDSNTPTYGNNGHKLTVDSAVDAAYNLSSLTILPALMSAQNQNDTEVFEIDYTGNAKFNPAQSVEVSSGNLSIASLGRSLQMATGNNAAAGLATIANGTAEVTVTTNACGPNSIILATNQTSTDYVSVTTKALGSFKLEHDSNVAADQSIAWFIINPEDVDYVSFITTASISDSTQRSAIATLISSLKSQGLWDAMYAIYPFVGGSSASHSYNLKNPAEYQITWSGTVTHDANGITGDGIDGYGDTNLAGNLLFQNNQHLSIYSRTNSSVTATDIGAEIAAGGTKGSHFSIRTAAASNPTRFAASATQTSVNNLVTNTQGLFAVSRTTSTNQVFFRNTAIQANSAAVNSESLTFPETITIGARKSGASVVDYSTRNYAFASIGKGLTLAQVGRLYAIVQEFQTTLGRNV
jgi:hypothetical protein